VSGGGGLPRWVDIGLIPLINISLAFLVSGLVIVLIGADPVEAVKLLVFGAFGYDEAIGYTLYYTTNFIFTGLAFLVAVLVRDRAAGLGVSIVLWLFLAALYDGLVLLAASSLSHYPLDKPMLAAMLLNPIDLARVMFLLEFDVAALMGYTGAVFRRFFGTGLGIGIAAVSLAAWLVVPLLIGMRLFSRKDL